ncbi:very short patch repair endonuclease [Pseudalkalibacillus caeni]|uniref:Very short patch repair endonuclease n=1 Tax=Exobacillus caeni TaxID=2574798 RepID=A0A5R9F9U7_9BACL|nr:very short patch repair endonuclease [Pseudalkalibacillus caeni]TLS36475.1 very short patch repair endonuclease [Pseudalkalibacillus caeni]
MVDKVSKETRRKIMQSIKSRSHLEDEVSKALWKKGIRFRKNTKNLVGKPDISIKKYKVVIFIDSCFWHACPYHYKLPKSNIEYWEQKFNRNKKRDQEVNEYYLKNGWHVKRIWEHELKDDFNGTINDLLLFIRNSKKDQ